MDGEKLAKIIRRIQVNVAKRCAEIAEEMEREQTGKASQRIKEEFRLEEELKAGKERREWRRIGLKP